MVALDVVEVDDGGRPCADLRYLRFPCRCLPLPRMVAATRLDPRAAEPGHSRAREIRSLGLAACAEREHVEPLVAGA